MTAVAYALGRPRAATSRGGDCRALDLAQNRNVRGPHVFATPANCQICNGLLRLTFSAINTTPAVTVEAWRGRVIIEDYISDVVSDTIPGSYSDPAWTAMGTLTIDSPSVPSATIQGVKVWRCCPEYITVRIISPFLADAFITLPRGWRSFRIQHGSSRYPLIADLDRRIRWTASPSPTGTAYPGRVEESTPTFENFPRSVFSLDPVTTNAGSFSITATSVTTARFGAGVGTSARNDRPSDLHRQLGDASRAEIVISEDEAA